MMQQTEVHSSKQLARGSSRVFVRIAGAGVLGAILLAIGIIPRLVRARSAEAAVREAPVNHPVVSVIHPSHEEPTSVLMLPGNIEPLYSANLFARVDGYLDRRNVDIGARVVTGQVLAVISAPEVDQQLLQARATLAQAEAALEQTRAAMSQAKANAELARLTKERDLPLGEQHAISQQIVDAAVQTYDARRADIAAAEANIEAAQANITANRANVSRLLQLQSFEKIVAPFDGVITARNVERGDLISANVSGSGKPLFSIAQSKTLRIQIDVPQSEAVNIKDGQQVSIDVSERVGRSYTGTVMRNASALNNAARTLLTEVQLDNKDGSLLPGMYAQAKFTLPQQRLSQMIPTSALVVDRAGMHVVAVDTNHTVQFVPVKIGKDMGKEVEVIDGLSGTESLVSNPSDLLNEGEHVTVQ